MQDNVNKFQSKGKEKLIKGSILNPENAGLRFILNFINAVGKPEGDIYKLFDKKWPTIKAGIKGTYSTRTGAYKMGFVNEQALQSDVWLINLLCQDDKMKTDLSGLEDCLKKVVKMAKDEKATIHISSLFTKQVPELQKLCKKYFIDQGVSVSYYEEKE